MESVVRRRVWQDGECGKTESVARRRVWQDGECGKTESVARRRVWQDGEWGKTSLHVPCHTSVVLPLSSFILES